MQVLLSTLGTRGDVQPLVALATQLRSLGHGVRLCVPPDFCAWIEGLGMTAVPVGPELRAFGKAKANAAPPTPEQRQQLVDATVATQFDTLSVAAQGCDIVVAATALQIATASVAELLGAAYVFAAFCPAVLPSPHHAPPVMGPLGAAPAPSENPKLWKNDAQRFNALFGPALNAQRSRHGMSPVEDVRSHVFSAQPWLAADATLAPWPEPQVASVVQTGAWMLRDERRLSDELEAFLAHGEPPVYLGFGSIRVPNALSTTALAACRALGRRVIVSRGWAELSPEDAGDDCLCVDEVNQQALFKRVAAVVHHGGAGTTTTAAHAGTAQVILPQLYDQHYWAERVAQLGIGVAHAAGSPTCDSLTDALRHALQADVSARAQTVAGQVREDGAQVAAARLVRS